MFSPHTAFHSSDEPCLSAFPSPGYHISESCAMHASLPRFDLNLDNSIKGSIWHHYDVVDCHKIYNPDPRTRNPGLVTHNCNFTSCMTHPTSYASFVQGGYHLMPSCHSVRVFHKWYNNNVSTCQLCSKSMSISVYVLPYKHYSSSQFDQKPHKDYK